MANNKARYLTRSWISSICLLLPQPVSLRPSSRPLILFRKIHFWRCLFTKNSVYIPCLLHLIHMFNSWQPYTFRSPSISDAYKSLTEWMTSLGQTYRRRIYTKIQVKNCFMNIDLLKHGFRITAPYIFTLSIKASLCTSVRWLRDRLENSSCCANHFKYSLYSLMHALEFSDFCGINSRLHISP